MKRLLPIFFVAVIACQSSNNQDNQSEDLTSDIAFDSTVTKNISKSEPEFTEPEKSFSLVDETKFPFNKVDSIKATWEEFKSFPLITEFKKHEYSEGKYYSNQTFSSDFKSYMFSIFEGGDCGPALWLFNCKEDSIISDKNLFQQCGWEGGSQTYSTVFLNDSTFTVTKNSEGITIDSENNYITDSVTLRILKETFLINTLGNLDLLNSSDTTWNELKN